MERLVIAIAVAAVVLVVAWILQRRKPAPPTQSGWHPPVQLDRSDFVDPEKPWLVVVFSSLSCDACEKAVSAAQFLASDEVGYQNIAVENEPRLHDRYRIEQVPLLLIADHEGVVRAQYVGPPSATEVWGEFATLRTSV